MSRPTRYVNEALLSKRPSSSFVKVEDEQEDTVSFADDEEGEDEFLPRNPKRFTFPSSNAAKKQPGDYTKYTSTDKRLERGFTVDFQSNGKMAKTGARARRPNARTERRDDDDNESLVSIDSLPELRPPEDYEFTHRGDVFSKVLCVACGACDFKMKQVFSRVPPIDCVTVANYQEYLTTTAFNAVTGMDYWLIEYSMVNLRTRLTLQDVISDKKDVSLIYLLGSCMGEQLRKHSMVNPQKTTTTEPSTTLALKDKSDFLDQLRYVLRHKYGAKSYSSKPYQIVTLKWDEASIYIPQL